MSDNLALFDIPDLKPTERLILVYIRALIAEKGAAFPSYETIAQKVGISRRTAIYAVKRLTERGLIDKTVRPVAPKRNKSNVYSAPASPVSEVAPAENEVSPIFAPYKAVQKNVKTEDENINKDAYAREIERHGFGYLRAAITDYVNAVGGVRQFSVQAIRNALKKAYIRMRYGSGLYNPPAWIATAIRNEEARLRMLASDNAKTDAVLERARLATAHLA